MKQSVLHQHPTVAALYQDFLKGKEHRLLHRNLKQNRRLKKMNQTRIQRVTEKMKQDGFDQILVSDPVSVYYLTGRMIQCMERMMVLHIDCTGNVTLVAGKLFPQPEDVGFKVIYFDDTQSPVEVLASVMKKARKTGIDKTWQAKFLLPLMQTGISEEYADGSYIVDTIRQIKTPKEQEKMIAVSKCNDLAMEQLIPLAAKGYDELEMADKLQEIYLSLGTEGHSFVPIIGYGENAADPHHESNHSRGKYGDAVVLDIGCKMDGYCADMTRTVFIGEVSPQARKIYEIVKEANLRGREAVRPGVTFAQIDAAARDYIESQGYGEYFTHRLGHNIGMEVHEWGDVSAANHNVVKPGMCFSIEPGIYVPNVAGVRIEDLVLVTEDGCRVLNNFTRDLLVV